MKRLESSSTSKTTIVGKPNDASTSNKSARNEALNRIQSKLCKWNLNFEQPLDRHHRSLYSQYNKDAAIAVKKTDKTNNQTFYFG